MPELCEIVKDKDGSHKHIWLACSDCGKEIWVTWRYFRKKGYEIKCSSCRNRQISQLRSRYRGGRTKTTTGYILIKLRPDDFFYPMAGKRGYVLEHRLIMARHLNRCLLPWEIVHHRNGVRDDNRLTNLQLLPSQTQHTPSTHWQKEVNKLQGRVTELEKRITLLEAENALLKST
ncbi:hypothetical protein ES708_07803 [subsurface metagenome]